MLTPLARRHGALDAHAATGPSAVQPTHFFARANEPKIGHRIVATLGRMGFDRPNRYDVVASAQPVAAAGMLDTPESDHNLVWAALCGRGVSSWR